MPKSFDKDKVVLDIISNHKCKLIDLRDYENWKDVVDVICSSELIISESLHGLIVAETYGIPSVWVEFIEHPKDWDFKFLDFYESLKKNDQKSFHLYDADKFIEAVDIGRKWEKTDIDYNKMLDLLPFRRIENFVG